MHLDKLSLINYKNISEAEFSFCPKLNCFLGDNGAGKTNILDSIYYLSFCKSYFNSIDQLNINHNHDFFAINGKYIRENENETIICGYKKGSSKQIKRNGKPYQRFADHIGLFPLVMISPSDASLINGGGEERRKFIDGVLCQYDKIYLEALIRYNRALLQRNNLLKIFGQNHSFDRDTLAIYDEQLIAHGTIIYSRRVEFLSEIIQLFQSFYEFVSSAKEIVKLEYQSTLISNDFRQLLESSFERDCAAQTTTYGIHKDDLNLMLGDFPIRKIGSQGQNKTYLVALKLAQFEFLRKSSGFKPILLLDDIFDKLDSQRVEKILELVSNETFGQIFITDTDFKHLKRMLNNIPIDKTIYRIDNGQIINE